MLQVRTRARIMAKDEDAEIAASIEQHGWHAIAVERDPDDEASVGFTYTIGVAHTIGHPEIVICGLSSTTTYRALSDAIDDIRAGARFAVGRTYSQLFEGFEVAVRDVHQTQVAMHLGYAVSFYRLYSKPARLTAVQLYWPDKAGRFPFERGCDSDVVALQPQLDIEVPSDDFRAFMDRWRPRN